MCMYRKVIVATENLSTLVASIRGPFAMIFEVSKKSKKTFAFGCSLVFAAFFFINAQRFSCSGCFLPGFDKCSDYVKMSLKFCCNALIPKYPIPFSH